MENEQYIESGLSVGTTKIANKYEIFTEEEVDIINNKIPELDERVSIIEYEIEDINSSLDNNQQQINNLVLGAVGDGNNAEVVQARGKYSVLNDRLNDSDKVIEIKTIYGNNMVNDLEYVGRTFDESFVSEFQSSNNIKFKISTDLEINNNSEIAFNIYFTDGTNASGTGNNVYYYRGDDTQITWYGFGTITSSTYPITGVDYIKIVLGSTLNSTHYGKIIKAMFLSFKDKDVECYKKVPQSIRLDKIENDLDNTARNNAEVVQARGKYSVLNDRLNDSEKVIGIKTIYGNNMVNDLEYVGRTFDESFVSEFQSSNNIKFKISTDLEINNNSEIFFNIYFTDGTNATGSGNNIYYYRGDDTQITWYGFGTPTSSSYPITGVDYIKIVLGSTLNSIHYGKIIKAMFLSFKDKDVECYKETTHSIRLDKIENDLDNKEYKKRTLPLYYNSYLEEKIKQLRRLDAEIGDDGDSFIFITDYHSENNAHNSELLIKEIVDKTCIKKVFNGGDLYSSVQTSKDDVYKMISDYNQRFNYLGDNLISIAGNHEYNNPTSSTSPSVKLNELTNSELYQYLKKGSNDVEVFNKINYKVTNEKEKVIYFCIGCNFNSSYDMESLQWLFNSMTKIVDGYSVVILMHNFTSLTSDNKFNITWRSKAIVNAIDAFNDKGSYVYVDDGVNYDFSNTGSNSRVMLLMCGHEHIDIAELTSTRVPLVATTCDCYIGEYGNLVRTKGTINEQAFDIVHINRKLKKINITRIGAGLDREFALD